MRALAAGIPYDEIGGTRLIEIDRRWQAKELEVSLYAKTQVELKLLDMSARSLGEAEDETETDPDKAKEKADKHARWEARGAQIKAEIREQLLFTFMPDFQKAMYVTLHGFPGERDKSAVVEPLEGVSKGVAQSLLNLIQKQTFSRGPWAKNVLWRQLEQDERLARKRLELTARGEK